MRARTFVAACFVASAFLVTIGTTAIAADSDFFIFASTHKTQAAAQLAAADSGGWVLITGFYEKLSPNLFAVVQGPYRSQKLAEIELARFKPNSKFKSAYVKEAGKLNLAAGLKGFSPLALAAVLGEVRIEEKKFPGSEGGCEPVEPYKKISLHYYTVMHDPSEKNPNGFKSQDTELDIGALLQIQASGAIDRMRICAE